ncbi:MAG: Gfo/Idh/MocA family oxidoreductase, partial [Myxococcota bacterium]
MIRVAVIGAGHWGPNLIANFHDRQRSEVAWVIDRDASRRQAVGLRFPDIRVSDDATHAFGDASVDAVVIATPTSTHFDLARQALEAGRHVLVEKPMADSVRDAEALCEIAERSARILMVGHVF